jgi:hypothetical protein
VSEAVLVEQAWRCDACGVVGSFAHYSDVDAGRVKAGVLAQHRKLTPECTAEDVPPIRFRERESGKHGR